MRQVSYWGNKLILLLSIVFGILFIKENFLMKKDFETKIDIFILETDLYFGISLAILILFLMTIFSEKNIKLKIKIEKLLLYSGGYIALYSDYLIKNKVIVFCVLVLSIFIFFCLLIFSYEHKSVKQKKIFPSREVSKKTLNYYLEDIEIENRAVGSRANSVLVNGNWGAGKTYFIESFLETEREKYIPIWIKSSLYENRRDIKKYILGELKYILENNYIVANPVNDLMKKFELIGNNSWFNFAKITSSTKEDFSEIKDSLKNLNNKKIILILDDLERIADENMIKEVISCISEIEDSISVQILILANIEQLRDLKVMDYLDKYYDVQINLSDISIREIVSEFLTSNEKKHDKNIIRFFNDIIENLKDSKESKAIRDKIINPRFIKRLSYSLTLKSENTRENIFRLCANISYHLLSRAFPYEDFLSTKNSIIHNFFDITKKIAGTVEENKIQSEIKLEMDLEYFKSILKLIPETIGKDLDDILKSNSIKSIELFFKEGENYNEVGEYDNSIRIYNKIIGLDPNNSVAYRNRGMSKSNLGNHKEAIGDYNKAIELNPKDSLAYNNRGVAKSNLGNHKGAIEDFNKAIELNPNYSNTYNNRGLSKGNLGNNEEAIEDFNKAIKLNPNYSEAYSGRGVVKGNLGNHKGAIEDFNKAIELNPKDLLAYNNRGILKGKLGDNKGAIEDFSKAIELNPEDSEVYSGRGVVKGNLGNHKGAIEDFNKAIELNPEDSGAYMNRGVAKANLGNNKEALEDFNKAIELNSKDSLAYSKRGAVKSNLKNYKEAIEDFNKAIELNPKDLDAYIGRGVAKGNLGNHKGAIEDFSKAVELNPKEALEDFNKAIALNPKDSLAYIGRGIAKSNLGDNKGAIEDFSKAIELNPKDSLAYNKRGVVKSNLENYKEAIEDFNKAIELNPKDLDAYRNRERAREKMGK